jgi:hypothetical protein
LVNFKLWLFHDLYLLFKTRPFGPFRRPCRLNRSVFPSRRSERSLSSSFIGRNWEWYRSQGGSGRSLNYCA